MAIVGVVGREKSEKSGAGCCIYAGPVVRAQCAAGRCDESCSDSMTLFHCFGRLRLAKLGSFT